MIMVQCNQCNPPAHMHECMDAMPCINMFRADIMM